MIGSCKFILRLNAEGKFSKMCTMSPEDRHSPHVFKDALNIGYGSVAYVATIEKSYKLFFLCAKFKLKGHAILCSNYSQQDEKVKILIKK